MQMQPYYGWRARIGRLTPNSNIEGQEEWRQWAPDGVAIHNSTIPLDKIVPDDLTAMVGHAVEAAKDVAALGPPPDVIIQCCAPGTFVGGLGTDESIVKQIQSATGIQATTQQLAQVEAMRVLGMNRIVFASAYTDELNSLLAKYLTACGFEVLAHRGLQILDPRTLAFRSPGEAYRISRAAFQQAPDADGILFSGGAFRTFEIIESLERDTGVPVVTTNQAALWKVLRMVGVSDRIPGLGRLFNE
jgi:maleate cis-trans isomerase